MSCVETKQQCTERPEGCRSIAADALAGDSTAAPTVCILGGTPEVRNLGVAALGTSAVKGVLRAFPNARILLGAWGPPRTVNLQIEGRSVSVQTICIHPSQSLRERFGFPHLKLMEAITRPLPGWARRFAFKCNNTLNQLMQTDVVLDVAGGDSFADTYGDFVFNAQSEVKLFMKKLGVPLILLPQTFGPFTEDRSRDIAREVLDYSTLIATRDTNGLDELRTLCGEDLLDRCLVCPDMAFTLDPVEVEAEREPLVMRRFPEEKLIGMNISGMLYFQRKAFGLAESYREVINSIARWVLSEPDTRLILVPHVISLNKLKAGASPESLEAEGSDTAACLHLMSELSDRFGERVGCIGGPYSEGETKYLAGCCDFFIGARMHSCIGAVSQGVPTVTLAYSKKAEGVMSHLGIKGLVSDMRHGDCLAQVKTTYERRAAIRESLAEKIPLIQDSVNEFFARGLRNAITGLLAERCSDEPAHPSQSDMRR